MKYNPSFNCSNKTQKKLYMTLEAMEADSEEVESASASLTLKHGRLQKQVLKSLIAYTVNISGNTDLIFVSFA